MDSTGSPDSGRYPTNPVPGRLPASQLRVGDAERQESASQLQAHFAAGRLTWEELDERLAQAWAARTAGELTVLFNDLPSPEVERPERRDWLQEQLSKPARSASQRLDHRALRFHPFFGIAIALALAAIVLTDGFILFPVLWLMILGGVARHRLGPQHSGHGPGSRAHHGHQHGHHQRHAG